MPPAEMDRNEYLRLVNELKEHHYKYHVLDKPEISDNQYDAMFHIIKAAEELHPEWIVRDSPTQRIGDLGPSGFAKYNHPLKMYSLSNVFNDKELRKFMRRFAEISRNEGGDVDEYYCDCKMDGLAVSIMYRDGKLTLGLTRGNGSIGEDITRNLIVIPNIPHRVRTRCTILVRGEVVVHTTDFIEINRQRIEKELEPFSNPRNYAAGSLRQKDPKVTKERNLRFYAWELINLDKPPLSSSDQIDKLQQLGFSIPQGKLCYTIDEVLSFIHEISRIRRDLRYGIDGVVIKLNQPEYRKMIGWNNHDPLWATAWKYTANGSQTDVEYVYWSMGRTGKLTPVAKLTPVIIDGVTISDVTLNNADNVEKLKLGKGGQIILIRSGDVIPKVDAVLSAGEYAGIPDKCPYCNEPTVRVGADLRCINPECKEKLIALLKYMVSKDVLDIKSVGESIVRELVDSSAVRSFIDVFSHIDYPGSKIKADTLDNLVKACHDINFMKLLMSLGIPGMGRAIASKIALEVGSLGGLIAALNDEEKMRRLMINEGVRSNLKNWYSIEYNRNLLEQLHQMHLPHCE